MKWILQNILPVILGTGGIILALYNIDYWGWLIFGAIICYNRISIDFK